MWRGVVCNLRLTVIGASRRPFSVQAKESGKAGHSGDVGRAVLDAALRYVPEKGWTVDAVALGAVDVGLPAVAHGLFQDPGASLVHHFIRTSNSKLVEHMKTEIAGQPEPSTNVSFSIFVANSVKHRLSMNIPYMDRMPEALSLATRPDQLAESLRLLLSMCDDICYYAGDRSTDLSWYTKRTSLAGVYSATELYMLQDKSADYNDTWQFVWRRFNDLKTVGDFFTQITSQASTIPNIAYAFYMVGRNALGANTQSRTRRV